MSATTPPIHFFLWVSHGGNVSHVNTYHVTDIPFKQIVMYSKAFKTSNTVDLENMYKTNTCDFLLGSCPIIPFATKTNKRKSILPTLVFCINKDDPTNDMYKYSGLYYLPMSECESYTSKQHLYLQNLINNIKTFNIDQQTYQTYILDAQKSNYGFRQHSNMPLAEAELPTFIGQAKYDEIKGGIFPTIDYSELGLSLPYTEANFLSQKIIDWDGIKNLYNFNFFAYAQIFDTVKKICRRELTVTDPTAVAALGQIPVGIDPKDIVLGIFSCQLRNRDTETFTAYQVERRLPMSLLPTLRDVAKSTNIYDMTNGPNSFNKIPNVEGMYITPTIIPMPNGAPLIQDWYPILNMRLQGCALNVLSLFRLIEKKYATEQVTCLSNTATSIFTVISYMERYLSDQQNSPNYNPGYNIYENQAIGYFAYRILIERAIPKLFNIMTTFNIPNQSPSRVVPFAIFFKMYKNIYIDSARTKVDHSGHTVAFYKDTNGDIYFVDPQQPNGMIPTTKTFNYNGIPIRRLEPYDINKHGETPANPVRGQYIKILPTDNPLNQIIIFYLMRDVNPTVWRYVDMIMSIRTITPQMHPSPKDRDNNIMAENRKYYPITILSTTISNPDQLVVPVIDDSIEINELVGGNKRTKKNKIINKHKNKNLRKSRHKSHKLIKSRKSHKSRKYKNHKINKKIYKGGKIDDKKIDDYEKLIIKMDELYNTPSVIDLEDDIVVDMDIDD